MRWLLVITGAAGIMGHALAFDATSTNFFIRHKIQSISGFGTSTSFTLLNAGGQTAPGTATSSVYKDWSGILQILFKSVKPIYEQVGYHWRNDDGSESAATSATAGTANTILDPVVKGTTYRIRAEVSNEGGTKLAYEAQQFRLEYGLLSTTCAAIGVWVDLGAVGGDWDISDSANLTDGANTTNIAVGTGGVSDANATFVAANGGVKDIGSQTAVVSVASDSFIEVEYAVTALAAAMDGGTYCFRVTNAGSTANYTYTQYGQGKIGTAPPSITFELSGNSLSLGTLSTASVSTASITATTTTNAISGFSTTILENNNLRIDASNDVNDVGDGAVTAGAEEYGVGTSDSGQTITQDTACGSAPYNATAITSAAQGVAGNSGPGAEGNTFCFAASISTTTTAGSYSHTVTLVSTGTF